MTFAIELDNVWVTLGNRPVLKGVNFAAPRGSLTVLMGPSGAGKSVLGRLAAGLIAPDRGEVRVFGEAIAGKKGAALAALRRRCALVLQGATLLDERTLLENTALPLVQAGVPRAQARDRAAQALERVGLAGAAGRAPAQVSACEAKLASIARALALNPDCVVYDEPTTGLDAPSARRVDALIRSTVDGGGTAVVTTHDMHSAFDIADAMAFLLAGEVQLSGPVALFRDPPDERVRRFVAGDPDGPTAE